MESYVHVQWPQPPGHKECLPRTYRLGQGGLLKQHLSGRSSFEFWNRWGTWGTWGPWDGLWLGMGRENGSCKLICSRYSCCFSLADSRNYRRCSIPLAKNLLIVKIKILPHKFISFGYKFRIYNVYIQYFYKYHLHFRWISTTFMGVISGFSQERITETAQASDRGENYF